MKIFKLGEIPKAYTVKAGGKAKGLDELVKFGYSVPKGFVIIDIDNDQIDSACEYFKSSKLEKVAVRSSATAEDGDEFSFAGQYKSILNVVGIDNFKQALIECLGSLDSEHGKDYAEKFAGAHQIKMSIVVQEMVDADFAGVCFTSDPTNADNILVEAVHGLGEGLVSGEVSAAQYSLPRLAIISGSTGEIESACNESIKNNGKENILSLVILKEICSVMMNVENSFGFKIDTEWAVKNGKLYLLQARPITINEVCDENEFDPKHDISGHITTRCNIGEMLPGAITPLTWSVSLFAIDWGLREMLRVAGATKRTDDLPPYSCAFSSNGHLFLNLSNLYRLAGAIKIANIDDVNFSICGRKLDMTGDVLGRKSGFFTSRVNTVKYLRFILSRNKARKKLVKISEQFAINTDTDDALLIYKELSARKHLANQTALLHYITSAHSGAMSSAVVQILNKQYDDLEKSKEILAGLLQNISGIESVDILASLRNIARTIISNNKEAVNFTDAQLSEYLPTAPHDVMASVNEFKNRHGHRCIREAELRSRGLGSDQDAFIGFLRTVISSINEANEPHVEPNIKSLVTEYGFKGVRRNILTYLVNQAREGVKNREYSKSKLVKVLDEFKIAYTKIAKILVKAGYLPDEDAIFFLTHEEVGMLCEGENPKLVKRAMQRRRIFNSQSELRFDEIYKGKPTPIEMQQITTTEGAIKGTSISRGLATGPARIVRNIEDAAQLVKGEIMVAVYTDIGWSPYYGLIDGLVTEIGSTLSHGAVVAREYALPFVSNVTGATAIINTGDIITVNGTTGTVTVNK